MNSPKSMKTSYLLNQGKAITVRQTKKILTIIEESLCKIFNDRKSTLGSGFFCKIKSNGKLMPCMITNNHVLSDEDLAEGNFVKIEINGEIKMIFLTRGRITYTNEKLDATIIEIFPEEDNIYSFLNIDENVYNENYDKLYLHQTICVIQHPKGGEGSFYPGTILKIKGIHIHHNCTTLSGSSGGPIILISSCNVVGLHKGMIKNRTFNVGTFIKNIVDDFNDKYIYQNTALKTTVNKPLSTEPTLNILSERPLSKLLSFEPIINKPIYQQPVKKITPIEPIKKTIYYDDGRKYEGEIRNGKKEGKGICYWLDGAIYDGQWKNDLPNGNGIYCFSNGDKYEGHFVNDRAEGKGIYYWRSGNCAGDKYEGYFRNDQRYGKGIYYYSSGNKYEGNWENDKKEGFGIFYYANGYHYDGEWRNDQKHGKGIYYSPNGKIMFSGFWINGKPIQ